MELKERTDEEVFAIFRDSQNGEALAELYGRFQSPLFSMLMARFFRGKPTLAEDTVQTVFLKLYDIADSFKPEYRFAPWLKSIAANCAIDAMRANGGSCFARRGKPRQTILLSQLGEDGQPLAAGVEFDGNHLIEKLISPDSYTDSVDRQLDVQHLLDGLSAEDREAVELVYFAGNTWEEAADIIGVPAGSLCTRLNRTLRNLRRTLDDGTEVKAKAA